MKREDRLNLIKNDLKKSRNILNVLGDVNTLNILLVLFENCSSGGVMVKDISQSVNLSRPAVLDLCQVFRHNFSRNCYFWVASYLDLFQFAY